MSCPYSYLSITNVLLLVVSHLFLVPLEIWEEDEADVGIRIFINDPLSLRLLLQDVVYPLKDKRVTVSRPADNDEHPPS